MRDALDCLESGRFLRLSFCRFKRFWLNLPAQAKVSGLIQALMKNLRKNQPRKREGAKGKIRLVFLTGQNRRHFNTSSHLGSQVISRISRFRAFAVPVF